MATQREKTHIQYPNMYKLYVSCNQQISLYTQGALVPSKCEPGRERSAAAFSPAVSSTSEQIIRLPGRREDAFSDGSGCFVMQRRSAVTKFLSES